MSSAALSVVLFLPFHFHFHFTLQHPAATCSTHFLSASKYVTSHTNHQKALFSIAIMSRTHHDEQSSSLPRCFGASRHSIASLGEVDVEVDEDEPPRPRMSKRSRVTELQTTTVDESAYSFDDGFDVETSKLTKKRKLIRKSEVVVTTPTTAEAVADIEAAYNPSSCIDRLLEQTDKRLTASGCVPFGTLYSQRGTVHHCPVPLSPWMHFSIGQTLRNGQVNVQRWTRYGRNVCRGSSK